MCTVTIIPHGAGIRLACNRDESRLRPAALPPRVVAVGHRRALLPIDPTSGGTWIAATDAGLVMTLMNVYPQPYVPGEPPSPRSRGTIIPALLAAATLEDACALATSLAVGEFNAFRLVMADRLSAVEFYSAGAAISRKPTVALDRPVLFTSSGLGDALVDSPRRALFTEFFATRHDWCERQDAFHRHSWPDRPNLSVCMRRPEARTVSLTIVELDSSMVQMAYFAEAPDQPSRPTTLSLPQKDRLPADRVG